MFIEIIGTSFINKGAELMLRSIIAKLQEKIPEAELVMAPNINLAPFIKRAKLGLYQKIWLQHYHTQWGYVGFMIPKKLRQLFGMVLDSEINVVLDASGFAYSDHWGPENSISMAKAIKKWNKQGTKVVLMPQAFGPFTDPVIRAAFKAVVENAVMIFSRDKASHDHIMALSEKKNHLKIAPDLTTMIEGIVPETFDSLTNRFCIIPNYRMIDKTGKQQSRKYLQFLINCVKYLQKKCAKPFILIHEDDMDLWIAKQLANATDKKISIVQETNALFIKGIIGVSDGVVSSRFHGLVSALSQGIPALSTGWSHKYRMLLEDYGFPEGLLSVNADLMEIHSIIDFITSDAGKQKLRKQFLKVSLSQKKASASMWDEIISLIRK